MLWNLWQTFPYVLVRNWRVLLKHSRRYNILLWIKTTIDFLLDFLAIFTICFWMIVIVLLANALKYCLFMLLSQLKPKLLIYWFYFSTYSALLLLPAISYLKPHFNGESSLCYKIRGWKSNLIMNLVVIIQYYKKYKNYQW